MRASWAALRLSSLPFHVLTAEFCKALPNEKDKNQGVWTAPPNLFMALRFKLASSSDCPPDKKVIPTHAGKMDLDRARAVLNPISSGVIFGLSGLVDPAVTILGL